MIYALDTNTVSYFIQDNITVIAKLRNVLAAGDRIAISPVVYYEIWRGFKHNSKPRKERAFYNMCNLYPIGEMNLAARDCAASIYGKSRRSGKSIEDTDILIAAFCIVNGYTLVTNNIKHFKDIEGLQYVDWST